MRISDFMIPTAIGTSSRVDRRQKADGGRPAHTYRSFRRNAAKQAYRAAKRAGIHLSDRTITGRT